MNTGEINGQPITGVIKKRVSVRTYNGQSLTEDIRERLTDYFSTLSGPFGTNVKLMLVDSHVRDSSVKLGTYGVIKNPAAFMLGIVEKGSMYLEDLGYEFEKAVLFATSLGLGTCWLGGTFNKGRFARAAGLNGNQELPVVSPIGFPAEGRSIVEKVMRMGAGSNKRKSWEDIFYKSSFNSRLSREDAGIYAQPCEMVRIAPSASNKQPWRMVMNGGYFHLYLQHSRGYAKALGFDIQRVDIGIAMCHFELSSREMGIQGRWIVEEPEIGDLPEGIEYIASWQAV